MCLRCGSSFGHCDVWNLIDINCFFYIHVCVIWFRRWCLESSLTSPLSPRGLLDPPSLFSPNSILSRVFLFRVEVTVLWLSLKNTYSYVCCSFFDFSLYSKSLRQDLSDPFFFYFLFKTTRNLWRISYVFLCSPFLNPWTFCFLMFLLVSCVF